jgi:phage/plasmid-associated DNA primase
MYNNLYSDDNELDLSVNSKLSGLTDSLSIGTKKILNISLKDYIDKKKVQFGDKTLTHQWWDNETNTNFKILDDEYDEFLQVYTRELKKEGEILHVMEQPKEIGPLCLDFDFKQISPERTICTDDIIHIISIINNIADKYFVFKNEKTLDSYVFMKKEPFFVKSKLVYSDGFHIMYPNLILNSIDRFLIYHDSRKEIIRQKLFSNVYAVLVKVNNLKNNNNSNNHADNSDTDSDSEFDSGINTDDDETNNNYDKLSDKEKEKINDEIFDPCVILKNKWFMYGSGKNIDGDINIYLLKYIFNYNVDEIYNSDDGGEKPRTKELVKLLAIRKPTKESDIIVPKKTTDYKNIIQDIKLKYCKKQSSLPDINKLFKQQPVGADNQDNIETNTNDKVSKLMNQNQYNTGSKDDVIYAKKLVKLLKPDRAYSYEDWISVGWALYNISATLLPEFIEFSKSVTQINKSKFDQQGCLKVWEDCRRRNDNSGYSLASLVRWAKEDNLTGYKQILKEKINILLDKGDIRTEFDIACILKEIYKYDYKCSSISKGVWWQFDSHRWNRIECAYSFSICLSTEVSVDFANLHGDIMKLAITETGHKADILRRRCKDIETLIYNLKKGPFKDRIIKECSLLFYEKDFESKLDQNNYLIGFTNGVYDLKNRIFRKGCPDDMIGKSLGYHYIEFDRNDITIKDIEKFIESIQPEHDMRKYLMAYCASFLEGSNKDQKFMIWTGCHAIDQGIMMADGTIKKVQDIKVGDQLMGDDLNPRNVYELIRGKGQMYKICSEENQFIVNDEHILTLIFKPNKHNGVSRYYLTTPYTSTCKIMDVDKSSGYIDENLEYLTDNDIIDISVNNLLNSNIDLSYFKLFKKNMDGTNRILNSLEIIKDGSDDDYYGFQVDGNNRYLMDDFTVTHNCGQNGKGSLIDLLDNCFNGKTDGYFGTLPPTVLTQKRGSSSAATPELADKFGKRVITLQEPEGDDKIHVGFMKNITGQDKIEARPLYGDPFQYTPQFKLLLACNHLPNIPSDDGGTWRRIRVIDFGIKFTSNPQNPNERKSDPKLREKIKGWNQGFVWLLINVYYPMYVDNEGLDNLEPESVKEATNKYKTDSNAVMEFFNEVLEKDPSPNAYLIFDNVWEMFRGWYTNSYNDKKPQRKKFKEYFDNNNFKVETNSKGLIIRGIKEKNPSRNEMDDEL